MPLSGSEWLLEVYLLALATIKYIRIAKKTTLKGQRLESRIRTYLVVGIGAIGAILLVLGIVLSAYGFSEGVELAVFGLVIVVVSLIVFVVATNGIDTKGPAEIWPGT